MKQFLIIAICVLSVFALSAKEPFKFIKGESWNFGTVEIEGKGVTHDFKVKNVSNDTLVITDAYAPCRCTSVMVSNRYIAPNDTATIHVSYSGYNQSPGKISKSVVVRFQDYPERIYLHIYAKLKHKKGYKPEE